MYNHGMSPTVTNCTFSGNSATELGGGMYNNVSSPTVTNCILWGDTPSGSEIHNSESSSPVVTYSDIQGGYAGTGNINADPIFVDPDGLDNDVGTEDDDMHLKSGSPCIDAGTSIGAPSTDFEGDLRPQGAGYDMGADEYVGLVANFSANPTSGPMPLSVNFTDQSTGYITSWSWDFGDGATSIEQNPSHVYTDTGTYTVSLTVTGPDGSNTAVKDELITVHEAFPWELFYPAFIGKK
jgi:predicted outer membrane repeat protein